MKFFFFFKKKKKTELCTIPMINPQPQITTRNLKYSKMVNSLLALDIHENMTWIDYQIRSLSHSYNINSPKYNVKFEFISK